MSRLPYFVLDFQNLVPNFGITTRKNKHFWYFSTNLKKYVQATNWMF